MKSEIRLLGFFNGMASLSCLKPVSGLLGDVSYDYNACEVGLSGLICSDLYLMMIQSSESFLSVARVKSTLLPSNVIFLTAENFGLLHFFRSPVSRVEFL